MTANLPESLADSWRAKGNRTGESSVLLASITAETTVFEPTDPADGLEAAAGSEIPVRSLFTVDLSISPSLSSLGIDPDSALEKAAPKARSQFVDTLESEGLRVDETRNTLEFEAANGNEGVWFVFDVAYPLATAVDEADDTGADENESAEPPRIDAEGHIAVWPLESTLGMAGGVLPLEGLDAASVGAVDGAAGADETPVANGGVPAADDDVVPAFDVDPERDRETIASLVRTIEPVAADSTDADGDENEDE
ncbi:hypothetical protein [Natronolimnohabitans innermongolicus]|uniref:Uncharacterized protein n=1 Tax=Natronolimnohabitans innermongolicus JCM 12255 TaxID=1227499 RepID=L9WUU1_9EURY|nr:hypothetical protein [Natronolimnohabitans innermongolicus]ELY53259.1 hypothetical protein C493_14553 [Natronolimnohabitans innermongolicus JCM 12255]